MNWTAIIAFCTILLLFGCTPTPDSPTESHTFIPVQLSQSSDISQTLQLLSSGQTSEAISRINNKPDSRYIAPLRDQLLLTESLEIEQTLHTLTNQAEISAIRPDWNMFIASNDVPLPQNYSAYKINVLRSIDSHYENLISPKAQIASYIRPENIYRNKNKTIVGELNNPVGVASFDPQQQIIGVTVNGYVKAYSLDTIKKHDIINDIIGGKHITLAYCSLCNIPVVYETQLQGGSYFTFKPTSLVYNENHLMYDNQTNTIWNYVTGRPLIGELVGIFGELPILAFQQTTWENWSEHHPTSLIVQ